MFTNLEAETMKLVVFGASGRIGTELVRQALAAGHEVTAVVREGSTVDVQVPAGVGAHGGALEVVSAEVMDPAAIASVISGQDAVLSALGPRGRGPTTVCADGTRSMVEAMGQTGVRRLLVVSAAAIHTTGDDPFTKYVVKPILGRVLKDSLTDSRRMEELVQPADLDWTIVCPPRLTNAAPKGRIRSNTEGTVRGGFSMTRADVATYLLQAVADESVIRRTVVIAN
ncbi:MULTISPECIES: NAD(P)H-binding protein [unclassified Kribbella]|uniref:NAD(P)-dependent oxidoreductase n=1 Tax=unclassified Kribbella TaxID=2644121 RepID=UPI0033DBD65F